MGQDREVRNREETNEKQPRAHPETPSALVLPEPGGKGGGHSVPPRAGEKPPKGVARHPLSERSGAKQARKPRSLNGGVSLGHEPVSISSTFVVLRVNASTMVSMHRLPRSI